MNENQLTDRDFAIEGYGTDYKGILPDGTVTGVMSYDGRVFEHYVESGEDTWRHKYWERDYKSTPLRSALEALGTKTVTPQMFTDEVNYRGTYYEKEPLVSCEMSGWRYDLEDKRWFRNQILRDEISLPAPAVFSKYHNIYTVEGYEEEVDDLFWKWSRSNSLSGSKSKATGD